MALDVTMEQVRAHLEDLGYTDVPPQVLADFTAELSARVSESADAEELQQGRREVAGLPSAGEEEFGGPLRPRTASETNRFVRKRGTRVGGKPACTDDREAFGGGGAGLQWVASGAENVDARPVIGGGVGRELGREASVAGSVRSVASTSFIRPQSASRLRPKKSDPVAAYQRVQDEWRDCPSVAGSRKPATPVVAAVAKPKDKPIWKSQHPLNNSEGTDRQYVVPSTKPRVKEMCEVRDSLKWSEVYKPHRTDRVHANEAVRSYVTPDEKRRDDVRWRTRVMMNSVS